MATYKIDAITPSAFRLINREGKRFLESSFGACPGYLQLNMAMLSSEHASDFEEFCHRNSAPCPLIYKSNIGEVEAPGFTEQSDIRTDLSGYKIYKNGVYTESLPDVVWHPWNKMVSFYLGCSFSFDSKLTDSGIKLKQLGLYTSGIKCNPVGVFTPNMVVSMRAIPKDKISTAVEATINVDYAHGAPIHIGRPEDIGIRSVEDSDIGFPVKLEEDEVPAFWACGITSAHALQSAKLPICFSHSPGCMFVSDVLSDNVPNMIKTMVYPKPLTICLNEQEMRYSILSEITWNILKNIEIEISEDPGKRGIKDLIVESDFGKACLSLSKYCSNVGIVLGFPCVDKHDPMEENDGIAGALYIAKALMYLGRNVTFIIDSKSNYLKKTLIECHAKGFLSCQPHILSVGMEFSIDDTSLIFDDTKKQVKFSHLISIERPSLSKNGTYHTMSGRNISDNCEPIDFLFEQAKSFSGITTIGIGDGGNEIGMGKVHDKVVQFIPKGDVIAAATSCDHLITCGVSNWGGLAVACGLFALKNCVVHDRYQRNGIGFKDDNIDINKFVLDAGKDEELHKFIQQQGFRDGISGEQVLTVDNLDYYDVHAQKLGKCRELARK